ncbi:MAG: 50S ribosomal protein L29 [Gemmatimonadota bacterium]|jgi:large subunit ribosomal protein L29|nr:50S ribosomal protein L29 [Gemmatimonadota bacterium]
MTGAEIRELNTEEIRARLEQMEEERFKLRFRAATQQLENPMLIRQIRRDVARMKTVLRERELSVEGASQ